MATIQSRISFPVKKRNSINHRKNLKSESNKTTPDFAVDIIISDEEIKKPFIITDNILKNSVTPRKNARTSNQLDDNHVTPPKQRRQDENIENNPISTPKTPSTLLSKLNLSSISCGHDDRKLNKSFFVDYNDKYNNARKALHSSVPTNMPARNEELEKLQNFINDHLENKTSGTMYISGPPGTGKTAALTKTLSELEDHSKYKGVYVNCTSIKSAQAIYSKIAGELGIKSTARSEKAYLLAIEKYLKNDYKSIILVLDEIDQLDTRKQSVLYTIFEWPSKPNSQLILIGIANALDLTDRILPRLQARCELKPKLLHFAPYSKQQIAEIIISRLNNADVSEVFNPVAVQMLAGKVAAISGDIRRALDIARRVVELVIQEQKEERILKPREINERIEKEVFKPVGVDKVLTVLNNVYGTCQNLQDDVDETVPLQQKLLLCSLILMLKKGKNKDITIGKLHEVYKRVCKKRNLTATDQSEFVGLCALLESRGMLKVHGKKEPRLNKISIEWDEDEVSSILKDKQLMSSVLEDESVLNNR